VQDRLLNPALAKEFKVGTDGVIVVARGTQQETINLGTDIQQARRTLRQFDAEFQKTLSAVIRPKRTAYLWSGHGELNDSKPEGALVGRTAQGVKELLQVQNYTIRDFGLVQGSARDVPEDATVVLILGPTEPFAPEELAVLERYIDRGGAVLLALEPEGKANNEELAKIAGVVFDPGILCNMENHGIRRRNSSDHGIIFSNRYAPHASVATLRRLGSRAVFFINAGSFRHVIGAPWRVDMVLRSLFSTWIDLDGNFELDEPPESKGAFELVAAISRKVGGSKELKPDEWSMGDDPDAPGKDGEKPKFARIFAVADSDALSDALLMNPNNLNGNPQFVMDALLWLAGDEAFAGPATSTEDVRIEHTKQGDKAYFYLIIFGAPALVLGTGLFSQWVRRRRARQGRNA